MQQISTPYFKVSLLYDSRFHTRSSLWKKRATLAIIRLLDVALLLLASPLLVPLCCLVALAIKWDSNGPVLFIQERVGALPKVREGQLVWEVRPFRMMKFRSMVNNADQSLHEEHIKQFVRGTLHASGETNAAVKIADDPRVTRVGRLLRKTSLDELPQLLNVFKGEMSLVGPRPVPIYEVAEYETRHYERLAAYPGITGLWQIDGRGEVSFEEMVRMDIEYAQKQSLNLYLKILVLTPWAVLSGRGAV